MCVCDAFGVPQPDDWPGIGPQPFVVFSSDFFFFLFIILFLSGTRHSKSIPMPGRFQTLKWQKIVQTSNTSKPKFHGLKSEAVLGDFGELSKPQRWVKKQTVVRSLRWFENFCRSFGAGWDTIQCQIWQRISFWKNLQNYPGVAENSPKQFEREKTGRNLHKYSEVMENSPKLLESFGEVSKTLRNHAKVEKEQVLEKSPKLSKSFGKFSKTLGKFWRILQNSVE